MTRRDHQCHRWAWAQTDIPLEERTEHDSSLTWYVPAGAKLKLARAKNIQVISGLEMFVQQGARQFEIWTETCSDCGNDLCSDQGAGTYGTRTGGRRGSACQAPESFRGEASTEAACQGSGEDRQQETGEGGCQETPA
jgi:hypothetical protein